ncbi:ATP-dependent helicase HrpB [Alteromonas pelagimontana]|uniref:ATP-dependent helicase HrpB n=1 Tax=Alteromonas pelagimontana TaxID=1858656 RepID=A0A6M4MCN7_9ALTE|nr:ATP-dependent helicase HrpB [Alteromonas pelagimontana]QJR80608.1 ATP-dependent helicase HrpB [Alteromonas pelagimontana]
MNTSHVKLPAQAIVAPLCGVIDHRNVIVGAPPGAGKSTLLPMALLSHFPAGRIVMLQPRRVVVRSLATFLASQLGEPVGQTVGYRIRGESKISQQTRLEIITEGVLTRMIQQDPELSGVTVIMFDEFHERSLHSDFGLALAIEVQQGIRDDLRLVIMSATLDVTALQMLLPDADVLTSEGRMYPVQEKYAGQGEARTLRDRIVALVRDVIHDQAGDILVFLPGAGIIRAVEQQLVQHANNGEVIVHTLFGAMEKRAQDAALQPDPQGRQKVILATNIAETSLTIEGVTVVIDSGLENVASFHPGSGFTQLSQQLISQASATQRKGRAGRLGPGVCYRLWAQEYQSRLAPHSVPQILREDVSSLLLEALNWGTQLSELALLDQPSPAQLDAAVQQLEAIGALDPQRGITGYGRKLAEYPCHPKIAHMLIHSHHWAVRLERKFLTQAAAVIAALAEELGGNHGSLTISDYIQALDASAVSRLTEQARRYHRLNDPSGPEVHVKALPSEDLALCIALAYPERIAKARSNGQYQLAGGKGAVLPAEKTISAPWLVVLHGQQLGADITMRLLEPIAETVLQSVFADGFRFVEKVTFNAEKKQMEARRVYGFHKILLNSEPVARVPDAVWIKAWRHYLAEVPIAELPVDDEVWQWMNRLSLARALHLPQPQAYDAPPEWPMTKNPFTLLEKDVVDTALAACRTLNDIRKINWTKKLQLSLPWSQQHALETFLPTVFTAPTGNQRHLVYKNDGSVMLSIKMQEMYGFNTSITVGEGRKTVTVELLSPAGRPLQMTSDLGAFWTGSYVAIQKEMKGRYPKHYWPDDPTTASPTTKTKKAMD